MNILMVLDEEFPPDGRVEREIHILQEAGHTVHLLCYSLSGQSGPEIVNDVHVIRVPISKLTYKFKALALMFPVYFNFWKKHILDQLNKGNYDIVHFHDLNLAKVSLEAAHERGLRVVGDYHENRPEIMKLYDHVRSFPGNVLISLKKWDQFQIRYSKMLDHLILVTDEAKEYYEQHYDVLGSKITVIENFPQLDQILVWPIDEEIVEKYRNKKMLVYYGDSGLRRGTDTIIEAARILKNEKELHFVIIGTSREQEKLISLREQYGLNNVELTGEMPIEKAISYFKASIAGLCPFLRNIHHDTTYANKLFQYMAFSKPVIVSDCTAQVNVVEHSHCGLIHEAGNAQDLADKVLELVNGGGYDQMSQHAGDSVKEKYNINTSKQKLINLYKQLSDEME